MSATVKRRRPSIASITSPLGSFGLPGSCAGPQTPSGNEGALCTSACILSMWALWSLSRVSSMWSTVVTPASPIGARPIDALGVFSTTRAAPSSTRRVGTALVSVISNSA